MVGGTTNPIVLTVLDNNVDLTTFNNVYVTFQQRGREKLRKTGSELDIQAHKVIVQLTQAESLSFKTDVPVEVQINWTWPESDMVHRGSTLTASFRMDKQLEGGELE